MIFHVLTLFPEMVEQGLNQSILGRAAEKGHISFHMVNIRDFTQDKHGKVDDYPYGGGAGMLMQAQPVYDAYLSVTEYTDQRRDLAAGCTDRPEEAGKKVRTIYVTPQGRTFNQRLAKELAQEEELVFLCGHYEGIDERVLEEIVTDYISIGDYVLTGGELPAMVMIDAIARLVPGVLHNGESAETESFHRHLLEYPQYSRPELWHGKPVPEVLLSGNHRNIGIWRLQKSLERTRERRPDLYRQYQTEQEFICSLAKQKRKYIHLMEMFSRGLACIVQQQGRNMLVNVQNTQSYAIYVESPEMAGQLMGSLISGKAQGEGGIDLAVCEEAVRDLAVREYGLTVRKTCYQACYTRREPLRIKHKDIRPLGVKDLDYVAGSCLSCDRRYLYRRLLAGAVFGVYMGQDEKKPAGYIGIHEDGSMGMLYVDKAYRHQGLAVSLESWLINQLLKRGEIPYCQVEKGNVSALRLQEKMGLYLCDEPMWWLSE